MIDAAAREVVIAQILLDFERTLTHDSILGANPIDDFPGKPLHFLLWVIYSQGMPAERAAKIPRQLADRLGTETLSVYDLTSQPWRVEEAFAQTPKLHRFPATMARYTTAAGNWLLRNVPGADPESLWNDMPTAAELQDRLMGVPGIGQKKAAMAVEILHTNLGYAIRDMHGSDVAIDVHVRRVALRTGIAERDNPRHIIERFRALHPERPGKLDPPMWVIGRQWCRPVAPDHEGCPLRDVCPKLDVTVVGVGAK